MPAPFSRVKFNARETALTSDQVRAERLMLRELQNTLALDGADQSGVPFSSALSALSLAPAAGFTMTLADGDAFFYYPTDPALTVDDSPFEVLRWRSVAALTFTTPDATNPRIDLVVAEPGSVDDDLVSRNILIDPVARTIAAQNVFKTTNPVATISVVAGTAAGSPAPPAVPAGKVALFEVYVPAAAASSAFFSVIQRLWRRAAYPWCTTSGLVAGLNLTWDLNVDFTTTSSTLTANGISHKVVIDGEVLSFARLISALPVSQDSTANPFGVAAGASDKPYYIYAVGGRHSPQGTFSGGEYSPVAIVESTVAPDLTDFGRPTSPITPPRGAATQLGAVYIGLGFVVGSSTRRRACVVDGDMTHVVGADIGGILALTKTGTGIEALGTGVLGSKPSVSQRVRGRLSLIAAAAGAHVAMLNDRGDGAGAFPNASATLTYVIPRARCHVAGQLSDSYGEFIFNPANAKIWVGGSSLATSDSISFVATGYDHRVVRLSAQV